MAENNDRTATPGDNGSRRPSRIVDARQLAFGLLVVGGAFAVGLVGAFAAHAI